MCDVTFRFCCYSPLADEYIAANVAAFLVYGALRVVFTKIQFFERTKP